MGLTTKDNQKRFTRKQERWLQFSQQAHQMVRAGISTKHSLRRIYTQLANLRQEAALESKTKHAQKYGFFRDVIRTENGSVTLNHVASESFYHNKPDQLWQSQAPTIMLAVQRLANRWNHITGQESLDKDQKEQHISKLGYSIDHEKLGTGVHREKETLFLDPEICDSEHGHLAIVITFFSPISNLSLPYHQQTVKIVIPQEALPANFDMGDVEIFYTPLELRFHQTPKHQQRIHANEGDWMIYNQMWQNIIEASPQHLRRELAKLLQVVGQKLPCELGSAAIMQWIVEGLFQYRQRELHFDFQRSGQVGWDFAALIIPTQEEYIQWFLSTTQSQKIPEKPCRFDSYQTWRSVFETTPYSIRCYHIIPQTECTHMQQLVQPLCLSHEPEDPRISTLIVPNKNLSIYKKWLRLQQRLWKKCLVPIVKKDFAFPKPSLADIYFLRCVPHQQLSLPHTPNHLIASILVSGSISDIHISQASLTIPLQLGDLCIFPSQKSVQISSAKESLLFLMIIRRQKQPEKTS